MCFLCKMFQSNFLFKKYPVFFFLNKIKLSDILVFLIFSFGWGGVGCLSLGVNQNITYFQHTFVQVKLSLENHVHIPAEYNHFDRRVHSIGQQHAVILKLKILQFFFQTITCTVILFVGSIQLIYKPTISEPQRAIILADILSDDKMQGFFFNTENNTFIDINHR